MSSKDTGCAKAQENGGQSTSAGESNGDGLDLVVVTNNDEERRSEIDAGAERKGGRRCRALYDL
jgi:hypothetical protein